MKAREPAGRAWEWALLLVALSYGAWTRLSGLGEASLWLDEILGVQRSGPEHGPLYYSLLAVAQRVEPIELAARLPFALAGVAGILLIFLVARECAPGAAGAIAAGLLAASPAHVFYSRDARPYSLLLTAGLLGLWSLSRAHRRGWNGFLVATAVASAIALPLVSANGVVYAGALLAGALVVVVREAERRARALGTLAVGCCAVGIGALSWMLYAPVFLATRGATAAWSFPCSPAARLAEALVTGFDQPAPVGPALYVWIALAAAGAVTLVIRRAVLALVLLTALVAAFVVPVVALTRADHWLSVRYVLGSLAPLITLAAAGAAGLVTLVARAAPVTWRPSATLGLTTILLVGAAGWNQPLVARARAERADWRGVAEFVTARAHAGDVVVASNDWTEICLGFYLQRFGSAVRLLNARESIDRARELLDPAPFAFLVAGGFHADRAIRDWMNSFHTLLALPVETISVNFHPDRAAYLVARATAEEIRRDRRAFWGERGGTLFFDAGSDPFLVSGWSDAERNPRGLSFRWMAGRRALVYVPVDETAPGALELTVMPYAPLAGRQRLSVRINDEAAAELILAAGWQRATVPTPAAAWRAGVNLLTFEASASMSPAASGAGDSRDLSICFSRLIVLPRVGAQQRP